MLTRVRPLTFLARPLTNITKFRMASTLPRLPIFEAITSHDPSSIAVVHSQSGRSFTYGQLVNHVVRARETLKSKGDGRPIEGERLAFMAENGFDYVVTLLAIFASDAIAVPLSPAFPSSELRYIVNHSQALMLLASEKYHDKAKDVAREGIENALISTTLDKVTDGGGSETSTKLEEQSGQRSAMMLYTSGTTSRPKGVLLPQSALSAQSRSLLEAWRYSVDDYLLHVLPLHHIHGTVNALLTPLLAGSTIEFLFPFNADIVWERLAAPFLSESKPKITFLTVVPTIWNRLLQSHGKLSEEKQAATKAAIKPENLRLNISGSAALPTPTKEAWRSLSSGNVLLERYGMTEVGMALSCGLDFTDRVDGSVGWPLPGVEVRLVDTDSGEVIPEGADVDADGRERQGEIQLRGPTIFEKYWGNPEATASEFVESDDSKGRWFKTGDVAIRKPVKGAGQSDQSWAKGPMYFIQGRKSADIIKTGGEKVSALEIERELLSLSEVDECAVVGLSSDTWGQKVAAIVVLTEAGKTAGKGGKPWGPMDMRRALRDQLANYKIPQEMKVVESIPRNAMGKINKKSLVKDVFGESPS